MRLMSAAGVLSVAEPLAVSELWAPGDRRLWIEEHNRTPKAMGRSRVRLRERDFLKGSCIIHSDQDMEAIKVSYDKRMDKEAVAHIYNGILLNPKKR